LLEIKELTVHYGKSIAVEDVSLSMEEGTIVTIIGANGAGKSMVLKALVGLVPLTSGEIWFMGARVDRKETTDIVDRGISLVPQRRHLFPFPERPGKSEAGASLRTDKDDIEHSLQDVYQLFPRLRERGSQKAGTISGGEQQMLAVGRGLMAKLKFLCMDEPSLGLTPIVIEQLGEIIRNINMSGMGILLV
jgi:branched-chain amino acid transport system ATP-binding protein